MNNNIDIWQIMNSAQVSTALFLIAISLSIIAIKLIEKGSSKSTKKASH